MVVFVLALGMAGCDDETESGQPDGGGDAVTCEEAAGTLSDCFHAYCAAGGSGGPFCVCYGDGFRGLDTDSCECSTGQPVGAFRENCDETGNLRGLDGPEGCNAFIDGVYESDQICW